MLGPIFYLLHPRTQIAHLTNFNTDFTMLEFVPSLSRLPSEVNSLSPRASSERTSRFEQDRVTGIDPNDTLERFQTKRTHRVARTGISKEDSPSNRSFYSNATNRIVLVMFVEACKLQKQDSFEWDDAFLGLAQRLPCD